MIPSLHVYLILSFKVTIDCFGRLLSRALKLAQHLCRVREEAEKICHSLDHQAPSHQSGQGVPAKTSVKCHPVMKPSDTDQGETAKGDKGKAGAPAKAKSNKPAAGDKNINVAFDCVEASGACNTAAKHVESVWQ